MEPAKETKDRNNRLSTKDFATAEERRDLNVARSQEMKDRNVEPVTVTGRQSVCDRRRPSPAGFCRNASSNENGG